MYRILFDRVFNNFNYDLKYKNKEVSGLSIYIRIKVFDKSNKEIGLSKTNDKYHHSIISDIFYNTDFTIDSDNKLLKISINCDDNFIKILLINHVSRYDISIATFTIDTFDDKSHIKCTQQEVDEKIFIEFLIDNHKDLEITDNINAQNCTYYYEEVKE